jgi:glycosyltransferase involved in cell wall biosynthesis
LRQANKIGKTILVATNPQPVNVRGNKARNYLKSLKEIVSQNNFENFVRFDLKDIPYSLWWKYFFASDLVLLPYRGGVGSGIFSDAMAVGKPVIASNIPYFKRIEEQYKSLKIAQNDFDFSRTIKEALIPKNYKKMESECKRYLKENGLTPVSKKYKELYLSLLE